MRFIGQNGRDEQDAHGKNDALDARDAHKPTRDIGIHLEKELDQVLYADYGGDEGEQVQEGGNAARIEEPRHRKEQRVVQGIAHVSQHLRNRLPVYQADHAREDHQAEQDAHRAIQCGVLSPIPSAFGEIREAGQAHDEREKPLVEFEIQRQEEIIFVKPGGHDRGHKAQVEHGQGDRPEQRDQRDQGQHADHREDCRNEKGRGDQCDLQGTDGPQQARVARVDGFSTHVVFPFG